MSDSEGKSLEPTKGRFEVDKFDGDGDFTLWKHIMVGQLEILGFSALLKPKEDVKEGEKPDPLAKSLLLEAKVLQLQNGGGSESGQKPRQLKSMITWFIL